MGFAHVTIADIAFLTAKTTSTVLVERNVTTEDVELVALREINVLKDSYVAKVFVYPVVITTETVVKICCVPLNYAPVLVMKSPAGGTQTA